MDNIAEIIPAEISELDSVVIRGDDVIGSKKRKGCVGTSSWSVYTPNFDIQERLDQFEKRLSKVEEDNYLLFETFGIPFVKNTVAQLLLWIIGQQPKIHVAPPTWFTAAKGKELKVISDFFDLARFPRVNKKLIDLAKFQSIADRILLERNLDTHPSRIEELSEMVGKSLNLLKNKDLLKHNIQLEFAILEAFDDAREQGIIQ